jgi:hypothetical protein
VLRQLAKAALPGIIDFHTGNHDLAEKINDYPAGIDDYPAGIDDF